MKVAVAMSGGVDSSTTAALLKEQGHDVTGITMILHDSASDEDAKSVADYLNIQHRTIDMRGSFKRDIIGYFVDEYKNGNTPNPCVLCNRKIKFGLLLDRVLDDGADKLATGHYARIEARSAFELKKGIDPLKDQSYFLWTLMQKQLSKILFPLGGFTKRQVRQMAKERGLPVADKLESQEICFIPDDDYRMLLRSTDGSFGKPGPIIDGTGREIGRHTGIADYTVGQRRGLGVAAARPLYVLAIDKERNAVTAGPEQELEKTKVECGGLNLISGQPAERDMMTAKIRYNAKESPVVLESLGNSSCLARFEKPQRAVAPGQSIVFYAGDTTIGGAVIRKSV